MNAKQEILEIIDYTRRQKDLPLTCLETDRIRAILETHELVPVDTRPFDPTLCGLKLIYEGDKMKSWDSGRHIVRDIDGCITLQAKAADTGVPWPATQSDGETLLRLLGVLV